MVHRSWNSVFPVFPNLPPSIPENARLGFIRVPHLNFATVTVWGVELYKRQKDIYNSTPYIWISYTRPRYDLLRSDPQFHPSYWNLPLSEYRFFFVDVTQLQLERCILYLNRNAAGNILLFISWYRLCQSKSNGFGLNAGLSEIWIHLYHYDLPRSWPAID